MPLKGHVGDAGADLCAVEDVTIAPGVRKMIRTGITLEIPEGFVGLIWDKSGISSNSGVKVLGGVIDSSYRGEIIVTLINLSFSKDFCIYKGMKIAQILIQPVVLCHFEEVNELSDSERGEKGFGSTGK